MRLTIGRGNSRKVYDLPHGSQFAAAAKSKDPEEVKTFKAAIHNICEMLGIRHDYYK